MKNVDNDSCNRVAPKTYLAIKIILAFNNKKGKEKMHFVVFKFSNAIENLSSLTLCEKAYQYNNF